MSMLQRPVTWLRLTFRWSTSAQSWQERLADGVLLVGLALGIVVTGLAWSDMIELAWWQVVLIWLLLLLPALVVNRLGWLKLFGPVLYYDMVRQGRRSRFILLRFLYALLLVFLLFCVVFSFTRQVASVNGRQGAEIAQSYFEWFMVAQFLAVVLLTPAYVGGAIAEEKERKTLEFMLATDLLNREIVLSKLGSRLGNLALIVLTGLPILSILQFLGGVDPNLVLAGFVITVMTIFGQAGLSILCSVAANKPRDAISLAYLGVVMYYVLVVALMLASFAPWAATVGGIPLWFSAGAPTVGDAVRLFNAGSLITVIRDIKMAGASGTLATVLPTVVREYTLVQGLLGLACTAYAVARLRRVALAQTSTASPKAGGLRLRSHPPVGANPMLWKELHCESGPRSNWISWFLFSMLLAVTFVPAFVIIYNAHENPYAEVRRYDGLARNMNVWVRMCNVVVGSLTILAVAVRAANSITSERDKQTLDTLLTTPLDSTAILHSKWLGSLLGGRLALVWLAAIWAVAVVTGGLHVMALPFVVASWGVYAAFAATLGCWFSVVCKTSMRATVLTILAAIGLGVGHWLPWMCCGPLMAASRAGNSAEHLAMAHAGVLTPPFVLGWLPFSSIDLDDFNRRHDREWLEVTSFCLVGLLVWSIAAAVLYASTSMRFRAMTNRESRLLPDSQSVVVRRRERLRSGQIGAAPWYHPYGVTLEEEPAQDASEPLDHGDEPETPDRLR